MLSKTEHFDEFMKSLGVPWVIRKAALKFGSSSVEIIAHTGNVVRITTLNPKGSWDRKYDTSKKIMIKDIAGTECEVTTSWEGNVLCSKLEGSSFGECETWRYIRGNTLVIRLCVRPKEGPEAVSYWWYERMEALQQHLGPTRSVLLRHIMTDQKRVRLATRKDTKFMRSILMDWQRWRSPADEFILPQGSVRKKRRPRGRSPMTSTTTSPLTRSASASNNALHTMIGSDKLLNSDSASETHADKDVSIAGGRVSELGKTAFQGGKQAELPLHPGSRHNLPAHPVVRAPSPVMDTSGMLRRPVSTENLLEMAHQRPAHYRSPSNDSLTNANQSVSGAKSRASGSEETPSAAEAVMVLKLHEFVEDYGISSVIPVSNPHDTSEPQLLEMSPEQAEETTARLRELESDMLLRRQEDWSSISCCGIVISLQRYCLPEHLRVWEMTLV